MIRKVLQTVVVIMLAVCLAAPATAKDKNITIGFSNAGMGNSWREFLLSHFRAEVAKHPEIVNSYITNANEKPEKQIADIEDLLTKGVDILVIYPTVGEAIIPAIEEAYEAGVKVIVFGGEINTDHFETLVTQPLVEFGKKQAEWLAKELNYKGKIIMFSGVAGNTTAEDRLKGARTVFAKYPEIKILDHQYTEWSIPKAKTIMETMIQAYPQIDGIWADSGLMSWPALQALKEAGRPMVPSTGDQLNGYAKFLVDNNLRGYIFPMSTTLSGEAVKAGLRAIKGEKLPKRIALKITGYGPEQIKSLVRPNLSDFWWIGDDNMPKEFLPVF